MIQCTRFAYIQGLKDRTRVNKSTRNMFLCVDLTLAACEYGGKKDM